jgi:hypothetical protein
VNILHINNIYMYINIFSPYLNHKFLGEKRRTGSAWKEGGMGRGWGKGRREK